MTLEELQQKYDTLKLYFDVIEKLSKTQQEIFLKNFPDLDAALIKAESELLSLQERRSAYTQTVFEAKIKNLADNFNSLSYELVKVMSNFILSSLPTLNMPATNAEVKTRADQSNTIAIGSTATAATTTPETATAASASMSSVAIKESSEWDTGDYYVIEPGSVQTVEPLKADARFKGHTSRITGISVVPEISWVVTGSEDKSLRIWSTRGECINMSVSSYVINEKINWYDLLGHGTNILYSALSLFHKVNCHVVLPLDDNKRYKVVFGLQNGKLQIFPKGEESDAGHNAAVTCLTSISNQSRVISGSQNGSIRVWSVNETGLKNIAELSPPQNYPSSSVTGITVLKDQDTLISGAGDVNALCIWSLEKGSTAEMIFSRYSSSTLWSLVEDGAKAEMVVSRYANSLTQRFHSFKVLSDENTVITCGERSIGFWTLKSKTQNHSVNTRFTTTCFTVLSDHFAITGSMEGYLSVWNLKQRACVLDKPLNMGAISCITQIPNLFQEHSTPTFLLGFDSGSIMPYTMNEIRPKNKIFNSLFASNAYKALNKFNNQQIDNAGSSTQSSSKKLEQPDQKKHIVQNRVNK